MKKSISIALKMLLEKKNIHQSELENIMEFYRTIVEVERSKESEINQYYPYNLHYKDDDSSIILIDLPCNPEFTEKFLENKNKIFKKDLYIGLAIGNINNDKQMVVFGVTIDHTDLKGYDPYYHLLPVRISDFSFDYRNVEGFQLTAENFAEIENELSVATSIHDVQDIVKRYFGEETELKMELQLALGSKNIALAQISWELNHMEAEMVKKNDLLANFLTLSRFDNLLENISVDELIQVTPLDESQASVVAHVLGNRFSVVTGAPGTGKTQVILNIIANALMREKSVLIASKNNKAVDNVKRRFDIIDPSQYLIRFGKKEYLRTQTVPTLSNIQNRMGGLIDHSSNLASLVAKYKVYKLAVANAKKQLVRMEELEKLIPRLFAEITAIELQIKNEKQRFKDELKSIMNRYSDVSHFERVSLDTINRVLTNIRKMRNTLQRKYSGILGIWHNLFSKKNDAEILLNYVEALPGSVKAELRGMGLSGSIDDFKNGRALITQSSLVVALLERISGFLHSIENEKTSHEKTISNLESSKSDKERKYRELTVEMKGLTVRKEEFINLLECSKSTLVHFGKQLVDAKIIEIERENTAAMKISAYKDYLPDNLPWKKEDIYLFAQRCRDFLSVCRLISVTSLSVKASFSLTQNLFDVLIIDEASQCDIASALPLIFRAKQVIVIGDPKQLKHITSIKREEEKAIRNHFQLSTRPFMKYVEQSLWDYSADFLANANQNNSSITLENHYRCHHDIIAYSNHQFYGQFLGKPLNVRTNENNMKLPELGIVMIDIRGMQKSDHENINIEEARECISLAKKLCSLYSDISIGIVTPFRNQADYIYSNIDDSLKDKVEVNTAHGFQGDERDVVIYSLVVTDNSPKSKINWIDNGSPYLVNVAVTRARQTLYVVGNAEYIKAVSPATKALGYLVRYAQSKTKR